MGDRVMMFPVSISIGPGELADRVSILSIKAYAAELGHDKRTRAMDALIPLTYYLNEMHKMKGEEFKTLDLELYRINSALWTLESEMRRYQLPAGRGSVESVHRDANIMLTAIAITKGNDRRAALKRKIDLLFGYEPEIKSHELPEV